ncbi:MAG: sulfate reduction electron transfer complex DsrMKJOP subunit DsrJ [Desulfovibrio sp.]|nr:sulfate reduction electron transfer complex DsrMKJOP subunit DsrJ [Desulfovibrio sp.]
MIYNAGYVLPGLALFAALVLGPFLLAAGGPYRPPALTPAEKGVSCIEERAVMAAGHRVLLFAWRDAAVCRNSRLYLASDGRSWTVSLEGTCLACHSRKAGFCDSCHAANLVTPSCWGCHKAPEKP